MATKTTNVSIMIFLNEETGHLTVMTEETTCIQYGGNREIHKHEEHNAHYGECSTTTSYSSRFYWNGIKKIMKVWECNY